MVSFIEYIGVQLLKLDESIANDCGATSKQAQPQLFIVGYVNIREVSMCVDSMDIDNGCNDHCWRLRTFRAWVLNGQWGFAVFGGLPFPPTHVVLTHT